MVGPPSAAGSKADQVTFCFVEFVQPADDVGGAEADLPSDSESGRPASVGAEIVDSLHVHAEAFGELACCQHGFEAEPGEALSVHTP